MANRTTGREPFVYYFFLPDPNVGCQPGAVPFWLGAAAIVLIFSFLGFFDSRLPFCSRLAMPFSLGRAAGYHASEPVSGLLLCDVGKR